MTQYGWNGRAETHEYGKEEEQGRHEGKDKETYYGFPPLSSTSLNACSVASLCPISDPS